MINKNLIQKFADIEYPKCGDYETRRYGNDRMNEWTTKNLYNVIELSNGLLCGFDKESIETRFCFADEGPQYEIYQNLMSSRDEKLKNYFICENLKRIDGKIKTFENKDTDIPAVWIYEDGICKPTWLRDERDIDIKARVLNEQDRKAILEVYKEMKIDMIKRLNTWWKRYGADKLHTWTYWADR